MGPTLNPEEHWEPRGRPPHPEARDVLEMMRPVIGAASIESVGALPGGLVNTNLHVRAAGRSWVLRVFTSGAEIAAKERVLHRLLAGSIPLAELVHAGTTGHGERAFAVHEFVEGAKLTEVLAIERDLAPVGRAVGKVLASLHQHHFPHAGFLDADAQVANPMPGLRDTWAGYLLEKLAGRAGERLSPPVVARLRALVESEGQRLDGLAPPFVLCHADFKPTNLLMRREGGKWAVAAVLDWEFALAFTGLLDIGQMLRWQARYPESFAAGLAEGYSTGATLRADWRRTAELVDLLNLVGFLDTEPERPRLFADVKERIAATL